MAFQCSTQQCLTFRQDRGEKGLDHSICKICDSYLFIFKGLMPQFRETDLLSIHISSYSLCAMNIMATHIGGVCFRTVSHFLAIFL